MASRRSASLAKGISFFPGGASERSGALALCRFEADLDTGWPLEALGARRRDGRWLAARDLQRRGPNQPQASKGGSVVLSK